nr:MAG TPA: hypothetical protein [Caudoviricetes sp.]
MSLSCSSTRGMRFVSRSTSRVSRCLFLRIWRRRWASQTWRSFVRVSRMTYA